MKRIKDELSLLQSLMRGLAAQFGRNCEVVLHDYEKPYEHTIVAIENGHVTGRNVGDCGTNLGLELLRGSESHGDRYNYCTQTKDGRILRSSSMYIKDEQGKWIGCLCINMDITATVMAEKTLQEVNNFDSLNQQVKEVFASDVNELLDDLIQASLQHVGVPVALMDKGQKLMGLKYLDAKGAFLIKKAGDRVAKYYDISKFTLYNYLDELRGESENDGLRKKVT
jgi:predicted transcriptional regulator YheO